MAATLLRLLVFFLGISHLFCLNAIPITRLERLMPESEILQVRETTHMHVTEEKSYEENMNLERRMIVQLNDYPGSRTIHPHTPWPPQFHRCAHC